MDVAQGPIDLITTAMRIGHIWYLESDGMPNVVDG